jgi:hypothetical protein
LFPVSLFREEIVVVVLRFTKQESKYGVPPGEYQARFLGVEPMPDNGSPRLGRDGKPMPPGIEWRFEVLSGPNAGRWATRVTSEAPTPRNSCNKMLEGVPGRSVSSGETVDVAACVGTVYRVVVEPSTYNADRTQVTVVLRDNASAASPIAAPPAQFLDGAPSPPAPPPEEPAEQASVWVAWPGQPVVLLPLEELRTQVEEAKTMPDGGKHLAGLRLQAKTKAGGWQKPDFFGVDVTLPF